MKANLQSVVSAAPRTGIFAHSAKDGWLVGLAVLQGVILTAAVVSLGRAGWPVSLLLAAVSVFLICTNYQCVAHNFLHNAFFRSSTPNRVFSVLNTLLIGVPQSLYKVHHLHHHKYNNDACDLQTGTTRDMTSTYRYARQQGQEEGFLSYSLLGFFRSNFGFMLRGAQQRGLLPMVVIEFMALIMVLLGMAMLNPWALLGFYAPVWILGQIAAQAENYLEHHGALPGDRRTDSVSCYGALYNLIWFNNGYHQEHHFKPQVHWTRIREIRALLPFETARRVVRGAHWFNFNPPPRESYARPLQLHGTHGEGHA